MIIKNENSIDTLADIRKYPELKDDQICELIENSSKGLDDMKSGRLNDLLYSAMRAGGAIGLITSSLLYIQNKDNEYFIPCAILFGLAGVYGTIKSFSNLEKVEKNYAQYKENRNKILNKYSKADAASKN